ncbi:hypothetical protein [Gryllotalpicola koreensis]|uniref:Uncharacterized protein n=1 Tax=Gryllotalpicola koreensis TaxID=993086 RepID=A0ABP8A5D4_9MICO
MTSLDTASADESTQAAPVARAAVALRPLGYGLVTLLWLVIFCITVALALCWVVVPPGQLSQRPGLTTQLSGDLKETLAALVVLGLVLPFAWGFALCLVGMALGPLLLAGLAFSRSLRRSYRREKLTGTNLRYDTLGGPGAAATGVAISLLPRRHTPYSLWATKLNARAWIPGFQVYFGLVCLAYVEFLLVFLFRWPVHNPIGIVAIVIVAAAFLVLAVWRIAIGWSRMRISGADGELPTFHKLDAEGKVEKPEVDTD